MEFSYVLDCRFRGNDTPQTASQQTAGEASLLHSANVLP